MESQNVDSATFGSLTAVTDSLWNNSNNSLAEVISVTATVGGTYLVLASGSSYNFAATGTITYEIDKNTTPIISSSNMRQSATSNGRYVFSVHSVVELSARDKVSLQAQLVDGGTATIRPEARITILRIG